LKLRRQVDQSFMAAFGPIGKKVIYVESAGRSIELRRVPYRRCQPADLPLEKPRRLSQSIDTSWQAHRSVSAEFEFGSLAHPWPGSPAQRLGVESDATRRGERRGGDVQEHGAAAAAMAAACCDRSR